MPGYKKGQVVGTRRGKDGQPVMFTDESADGRTETWNLLQESIKAVLAPGAGSVAAHALPRAVLPVVLPQAV